MSTTVTTPVTDTGFDTPSVSKLPQLLSLGTISEVGEAKESKGALDFITIKIAGARGSKGQTFNLFFHPAFFTPGAKADSFKAMKTAEDPKAGEKLYKSFIRNIIAPAPKPTNVEDKINVATLEALCGSSHNLSLFARLRNEAFSTKTSEGPDLSSSEVRDLLYNFLLKENPGQQFIFKLRQRQEKIEGGNEDGSDMWVNADGYEVDKFFVANDATISRLAKTVKNSKGDLKFTFELD